MNVVDEIFGEEKTVDNHAVSPLPERLKKHSRVLIITGDKVEDIEFFYPYYRLTEAGYTVDVATIKGGAFAGKHGIGLKDSKAVADVQAIDYGLLYLPGGQAPQELRKNDDVLRVVKEFAAADKPIAAICHGPQILVSADLVRGKQMAAWPEVAKEIEEAGGTFIDEALVEDGQFITARKPGDLHRHLAGVLQFLDDGKHIESRSVRKAAAANKTAAAG